MPSRDGSGRAKLGRSPRDSAAAVFLMQGSAKVDVGYRCAFAQNPIACTCAIEWLALHWPPLPSTRAIRACATAWRS